MRNFIDKKVSILYKLFICWLLLFGRIGSVQAELCDEEHIDSLEKIAEDVKISYEYIQSDEVLNLYNVSFVGVIEDFIVYVDGTKYMKTDFKDGMFSVSKSSGSYQVEFYSDTCPNVLLSIKELVLPKFNTYSLSSECKELDEYHLEICDEWYQAEINDEVFFQTVNSYLNSQDDNKGNLWNQIVMFFKEYYLYLIGSVILLLLIVVGVIIHRKRSVLE